MKSSVSLFIFACAPLFVSVPQRLLAQQPPRLSGAVHTLLSQQAVSFFKLYLEQDSTYHELLAPSLAELSRSLFFTAELTEREAGSIDLLLADPCWSSPWT